MHQRNWLITGVSSGFGRIMTEQLLARGDRIAGTLRDPSVMNDLKAEYGDNARSPPESRKLSNVHANESSPAYIRAKV
jgi:NAD(P)-dependent dehydrogenase (short-subunit alcohol dehydrogenase family)